MRKGLFIVFEGPDRAGKSTQAGLLVKSMRERKIPVLHTREPGGISFAEEIRKILLDPRRRVNALAELLLYEAARAQHSQEHLIPALNSGLAVICERFTLATLAYQGYGRGLPLPLIRTLNRAASGGLKADITFLIDMPEAEFTKRRKKGGSDRIEREGEAFHARVRAGYRAEAPRDSRIMILDGRQEIENLQQQILDRVLKKLS